MEAYIYEEDAKRLDDLLELCGKNKELPKEFEQQALVALSHYPELREVPIAFKFKKKKIAHTSRPVPLSMFRSKKKRKYEILISTEVASHLEGGMLKNMSYNAQIGVLGHELAHTAYYLDKSFWHLLGVGFKYSFKKFVRKFENETDILTIEHNLGYQLLAWSETVSAILESDGRGEFYLKPEEILEMMKVVDSR